MCDWGVSAAVISLAASAASTYAAYQASEQQDASNAGAIRDRANAENINAQQAMSQRQQTLREMEQLDEERRMQKQALADQHLAESGADSTKQKIDDESASLLSQKLGAVTSVNAPSSSAVGGDETGVRVVADERAATLSRALQARTPQQQALASMLARQNVGVNNQIALSNMANLNSVGDNIYAGRRGAIGLADSLSGQLYQLGQYNAGQNFANAQSRLPYVGQGWRTGAGISQGVGNLAGSYASYSAGQSAAANAAANRPMEITGTATTASGNTVPTINGRVPDMAAWSTPTKF